MKGKLLWPIFGWGLAIIGIITGLALVFAPQQMAAAAHSFAGFVDTLPVQLTVITWTITIGFVLIFAEVIGTLAYRLWDKHIDVLHKQRHINVKVLEQGQAALAPPWQYMFYQNQPMPAPKTTIVEAPEQKQLPALANYPSAPPFSQMKHLIGSSSFPLGWGLQGPIMGEISDLLSTGILGNPRYGKSTALRYLVAVSLIIGADILGWDPHATIVEEYGPLVHIVEEKQDILRSAKNIKPQLERRLEMRKQKLYINPLVILIDELPALIAGLDQKEMETVVAALEAVILEGPKVRMYVIVCGQGLPARLFKDSTSRNSLSSKFVFYVKREQARQAGIEREAYDEYVEPLKTLIGRGIAYFECPSKAREELIAIPYTTEEDLGQLLLPDRRLTGKMPTFISQEQPFFPSTDPSDGNSNAFGVMSGHSRPVSTDELIDQDVDGTSTDTLREKILALAEPYVREGKTPAWSAISNQVGISHRTKDAERVKEILRDAGYL